MRSRAASAAKGGRKIARQVWQNVRRAATSEKGYLHDCFAMQALRNNPKIGENGCYLLMFTRRARAFVHIVWLFKTS
ncbi:hypothetical protein C3408_08910 [Candidatus Pantoea alvi]|nr:hypothetical protein C3408_08910 [Pantoea alvi]